MEASLNPELKPALQSASGCRAGGAPLNNGGVRREGAERGANGGSRRGAAGAGRPDSEPRGAGAQRRGAGPAGCVLPWEGDPFWQARHPGLVGGAGFPGFRERAAGLDSCVLF